MDPDVLERYERVKQNTEIAKELYGLTYDNLVLIADGWSSYLLIYFILIIFKKELIYIVRIVQIIYSRENLNQSEKKRPLVKPFIFVTSNGRIIGAYGVFPAKN